MHTPGPWTIDPKDQHLNIQGKSLKYGTINIAFMAASGFGQDIEDRANTRLILAAPELLDALKTARELIAEEWPADYLEDIDKVIAKAEKA